MAETIQVISGAFYPWPHQVLAICRGVEPYMECKKGAAAMLEWRSRFLSEGVLQEEDYDLALRCAEALENTGVISASEWIELVRQANAALLRLP